MSLRMFDRLAWWTNVLVLVSMGVTFLLIAFGREYLIETARAAGDGGILAAIGMWDPPRHGRSTAFMQPLPFCLIALGFGTLTQILWSFFDFSVEYPSQSESSAAWFLGLLDNRGRGQWFTGFFALMFGGLTLACMLTRYYAMAHQYQ